MNYCNNSTISGYFGIISGFVPVVLTFIFAEKDKIIFPPYDTFYKIIRKFLIYMSGISIFKKPAENSYLGGFWGEKSRGANGFSI